jgi:hypothetical protein
MKDSKSTRPAPRAGARAAEVVLDVDMDGDLVHLVLVNCGDAVATKIRVEFSRPLAGIGEAPAISGLPVFTQLGVLRPGRPLRIFWGAAPALMARPDACSPFVATVTWSERSRPRQRAEYHHDLSIYQGWPQSLDPGR